jgi:hypothetical protein
MQTKSREAQRDPRLSGADRDFKTELNSHAHDLDRKRVVFPSGDWVKFGLTIAPWVIQKK